MESRVVGGQLWRGEKIACCYVEENIIIICTGQFGPYFLVTFYQIELPDIQAYNYNRNYVFHVCMI